MSVKMECPSCRCAFPSPEDDTELPSHGAVAVCLTCAVVAVWDRDNTEWLPAIGKHLRELLTMPSVVETVMRVRQWHDQRAKDRQDLSTLISYGLMAGLTVPDIVETLLEDGFHRHPHEEGDN